MKLWHPTLFPSNILRSKWVNCQLILINTKFVDFQVTLLWTRRMITCNECIAIAFPDVKWGASWEETQVFSLFFLKMFVHDCSIDVGTAQKIGAWFGKEKAMIKHSARRRSVSVMQLMSPNQQTLRGFDLWKFWRPKGQFGASPNGSARADLVRPFEPKNMTLCLFGEPKPQRANRRMGSAMGALVRHFGLRNSLKGRF